MNTRRQTGYTMVEIMVVVVIIGLLAAVAVPSILKSREASRERICLNNQRQIDAAKELYGFDRRKPEGTICVWDDILPYLHSKPICPAGGTYELGELGPGCYCPLHDYRFRDPP